MRRILLTILFTLLLAASSFATTVTVSAYRVSSTWTFGGATAEMRIYATKTFVSGANTVVGGTTNGFYKIISCTVTGVNVDCPSFTLDSTTDSNVPSAEYVADLYDTAGSAKKLRTRYMEPFPVPLIFGTTVTWAQLRQYQQTVHPIQSNTIFLKTINTTPIIGTGNFDLQTALVCATSIKTVNGNCLLGSGDVAVTGIGTWGTIAGTLSSQTDLQNALNTKQAALVSGTNIKTINSQSLLGSGDIAIAGGSGVTLANTYGNSLATAISTIGSTKTTLLIDADTSISTGLTIPSTVTLAFANDAKITLSGSSSLVFQGTGMVNPLSLKAAVAVSLPLGSVETRDFYINTSTDIMTRAGHGLIDGQRVRLSQTVGTPAGGLTANGVYFVHVLDSSRIQFATTYANAIAGTVIDLTSAGSSGQQGFLYVQPLEWTGGAPSRISTEIIDTGTDSVTDRLKVLDFAFWSKPVTFFASPRPITSYVLFQDFHSVWFTSGDYIHTYTPVDSVSAPFVMGSYSKFSSDGSARVYTSTDAIDNCNVVSTKYHSTHVAIEGIHFMHGGGTDLGGNQSVASLYETSYSTIRNNVFDGTQTYSAGIIGNRQNFTDSIPQFNSIENNTSIGYLTQVFYIISGQHSKINNNKILLSDAVGGGQAAIIDIEPNTQYDRVEDIEIAGNYVDARNQTIVARGIEIQSGYDGARRVQIHHNTILCDNEDETVTCLLLAGIEIIAGRDIDIDDNTCIGSPFGCVNVLRARNVNVRRNHAYSTRAAAAQFNFYGSADVRVIDNILDESGSVTDTGTHEGRIAEQNEAVVPFTSIDGAVLDYPNAFGAGYDYYKGLTIWYNEIPHTITAVSTVQSDLFNKHLTITPTISPVAVMNVPAANVDPGTDTITTPSNHNLVSGDFIWWFCDSGNNANCPGGTQHGDFFYINKTSNTTFKLTLTHADALAGTNFVNITSAGTGTHSYNPTFRTNFTNVFYSGNYVSGGEDAGSSGYNLLSTGTSQILSTSTDRRLTNVGDSNHTSVQNTGVVCFGTRTAGRTETLPDPTFIRGKEIVVKDCSGQAGTYAITVSSAVGNIDGASSYSLETDYSAIRFKSDGSNWVTVP